MSWAAGRRTLILGIIAVVVILIVGTVASLTLHQAPSCMDGKQNQDERGIDCGGVCTTVCSNDALAPAVSFVRGLPQSGGRTDVIAYIENPNPTTAAKAARYRIELYSPDRAIIATKNGTIDLPPGAIAPVFIPNFFQGNDTIGQAFLTFDDTSLNWYRYEDMRVIPTVEGAKIIGTTEAPRVSATITNTSVKSLPSTKLVATLFDAAGKAIAASQTVTPSLPAQGSVEVIFTWNMPFSAPVSRIDVRPIVPLP